MENSTTPGSQTPASINTPASPSNVGAISSAIAQAVPPNRSNVQSLQQSQLKESVSERSNLTSNTQDKTYSLEDFDAEENPFTPKPRDTKPAAKPESIKLQKERTPVQEQHDENEENEQEEQNTKEGGENLDINKESDNKLDLDLNLDENADPLAKQKQEEQQVKGKRDYTKFKPEHVEFLKKLPNHLFAKAAEELTKAYTVEQENNQLKEKLQNLSSGKLPENYYEHENAYQLSPEYGNIVRELEYDSFEERHWQTQLANIKRGLPWINLLGYDQKTGQPSFEKIDSVKDGEGNVTLDVDSELKVSRFLQSVNDLKKDHSSKLESLRQGHKLEYQKSREGLDGLKKQFFSAFLDESKLPPAVKADLQLAKDAIGKQLPAFKTNPAMELLIYSYAALKAQNRQIIKMAQLLNSEKERLETSRRAGPGKMDFQGGTTNGDRILSASDFDD